MKLKIKKQQVSIVLFSIGLSSFMYFDGFAKLLLGLNQAGQYNPFLAVLTMFLLVFLHIVILKKNNFRMDSSFLFKLILVFSLMFFIVVGGNVSSLFRDVIYILILVTSFYFFDYFALDKSELRVFAISFFYGVCVFYPILGFLLGLTGYDDRFAGFSLSPTIFSFVVFVAYSLVRLTVKSVPFLIVAFIVSLNLVLLSETRTELGLFVVFEAVLLLSYFSNLTRNAVVIFGAIASVGLLYSFSSDIGLFLASAESGSRVLSVDDLEHGSLATRIIWYSTLMSKIISDSYMLGGFGGGAAFNTTGFVTHFDFLRYWFDYGVLFLLLVVYIIVTTTYEKSEQKPNQVNFLYLLLFLVLASMHNVFQSPCTVVLTALYIKYARDSGFIFEKVRKSSYRGVVL